MSTFILKFFLATDIDEIFQAATFSEET